MPRRMVPQGLALGPGRTAYISGYLNGRPGNRPCQILRLNRVTGRASALVARLEGAVPGQASTFCRHGGGIALSPEGLWVAETHRLWLLDPEALGTERDPVLRIWGLARPVRGSAMVARGGRIGLAGFTSSLPGKLRWYDAAELLQPGVTTLAPRDRGPQVVGARGVASTPPLIQGVTVGPGGVWFSRSHTRCGELSGPEGDLEFIPGAEGIAFEGNQHIWVVSESGANRFRALGDRPVIPTLTRVEIGELGSSPGC